MILILKKYLSRLFKWDRKKILKQLASYFTAHDMCTLTRNQVSGDSYPEGFPRPDKYDHFSYSVVPNRNFVLVVHYKPVLVAVLNSVK